MYVPGPNIFSVKLILADYAMILEPVVRFIKTLMMRFMLIYQNGVCMNLEENVVHHTIHFIFEHKKNLIYSNQNGYNEVWSINVYNKLNW